MHDGSSTEAAAVGNEGIVGMEAFLGGTSTGTVTAIQEIPGRSLVMDARSFSREAAAPGRLHDVVLGYTRYLMAEAMQTGACNGLHSVEERIGRSLLVLRDRTRADAFPLTQDFLSRLLGVTRPSVSTAAGVLQKSGVIAYHRGQMTILDRTGLQGASCECYEVIKAEYERLMPVFS
jgi:CRP-like cAMP-binding protein